MSIELLEREAAPVEFVEVPDAPPPAAPLRTRGLADELIDDCRREGVKAAIELLETARAILRERGWIQGTLGDEWGRCAEGALNEATTGCFNRIEGAFPYAYRVAHAALRDSIRGSAVHTWNDRPWRTFGSVDRAFRRASRALRAKV